MQGTRLVRQEKIEDALGVAVEFYGMSNGSREAFARCRSQLEGLGLSGAEAALAYQELPSPDRASPVGQRCNRVAFLLQNLATT